MIPGTRLGTCEIQDELDFAADQDRLVRFERKADHGGAELAPRRVERAG